MARAASDERGFRRGCQAQPRESSSPFKKPVAFFVGRRRREKKTHSDVTRNELYVGISAYELSRSDTGRICQHMMKDGMCCSCLRGTHEPKGAKGSQKKITLSERDERRRKKSLLPSYICARRPLIYYSSESCRVFLLLQTLFALITPEVKKRKNGSPFLAKP